MDRSLGVLRNLSLREVWDHEALDFTPWLVREENLALLSNALGFELQLERTEVPVGSYSADILAKDSNENYIVIECQFKKTNHDHLGKLITYGATLNAPILIWVAETFSDEHLKAIQWLNDRTTEEFAIYAVQPEILQIDNSSPAIRFSVVGRPNEIVRAAAVAKSSGELSETQALQLEFWTLFRDRLLEKKIITSPQTPRPQYWFNIPLGRARIHLSTTLNTFDERLGIRVYINSKIADAALAQLTIDKVEIEKEIGAHLQWNPNPSSADKIVSLSRSIDVGDKASWPEYCDWLVDVTEKFLRAFRPRVKRLKFDERPEGV